ncbi:MAG: bifunctional oligoribonuclease/PAP phosphatase NrnA [Lachnospiraceae bacterium]|nr:bifunctional oligoribonuclease/PAP phosphatase NrnA [Lachnospiraceae bacterium]
MIDLIRETEKAGEIGIIGHIRPDGDCVGSCLALKAYLENVYKDREKRVTVYLEKPAEIFSYLKGYDEIDSEYTIRKLDVCFSIDVSSLDRLGEGLRLFQEADRSICIDHHISNNGLGDVNLIEPGASSTSEVLATLFLDEYMDAEVAKAVFTGIVHDSGVFQYSCMSRRSFEIVGKLCDYDFDRTEIIDETFYRKSYAQNQILGRTLMESILFMNGRCIAGAVNRKTMDFYNLGPKDLDGIVNQLRVTRGVEVAIFMYELHSLEYKVSMRSNGRVDVAKIAELFGGGGHVRAAGCTMNGTYYDVLNNLSAQIVKQLDPVQ